MLKYTRSVAAFLLVVAYIRSLALGTNHRLVGYERSKQKLNVVSCGTKTCKRNEYCCNASCNICAVKGSSCRKKSCSNSTSSVTTTCGKKTCKSTEYCCNKSCSICSPIGGICIQMICSDDNNTTPPQQKPVQCGKNTTCAEDKVCCNPSCGICAGKDEVCIAMVCIDEDSSP